MAPTKHHRPRRNDDQIPDDVLLPLAPIAPPILAPQQTQAMMPYAYALPPARPRPSRSYRAASAVKRKAAELAQALKPKPAVITKEHLFGVGANAAGGILTAVAANELVDNVGVMPMAVGAAIAGGLGSAFLQGNWQHLSQGVLAAGVGQLGTAYLTERALKKAAAAQKLAAGATTPNRVAANDQKRNAYLGGTDDDTMIRTMEPTHSRALSDEANIRVIRRSGCLHPRLAFLARSR